MSRFTQLSPYWLLAFKISNSQIRCWLKGTWHKFPSILKNLHVAFLLQNTFDSSIAFNYFLWIIMSCWQIAMKWEFCRVLSMHSCIRGRSYTLLDLSYTMLLLHAIKLTFICKIQNYWMSWNLTASWVVREITYYLSQKITQSVRPHTKQTGWKPLSQLKHKDPH